MEFQVEQPRNNLIVIKTGVKMDTDFTSQTNFYYRILNKELLNKIFNIITVQPQIYSLGYELKSFFKKLINGKEFLFNNCIKNDGDVLLSIIQSEEFKRGLLFIVLGSEKNLEIIAIDINKALSNWDSPEFSVNEQIYYCENDGNTICLYNSTLTKEYLTSLQF